MSRTLSTDTGAVAAPRRRRGLAILITTALATAFLPVAVANAAPTAVAALTAGKDVFPGAASFTINVTNNRTAPLGLAGGETVNFVDIKLPNTAGIKTSAVPTAPQGWTATRTSAGGLQTYTFRGGSIAPGSSLPFTFPASVAAPTADRSGTFEVAVSSDNGRTSDGAEGALTTVIRTLDIVEGSLKATAPSGVTDGTATAGQTIDYAFQVRNLARGTQTVSPQLSSDSSSDTIQQAPAQSLAAGAVGTFVSKLTFGGSSNRPVSLTAAANASPSQALTEAASFTVQAPAELVLDAASFKPTAVRPNLPTSFTIDATKFNDPALNIASSSLSLPTGVTANGGALSFSDGATQTLSFGPASATGADNVYDVTFSFAGTDSNGFGFTKTQTLSDALTLDSIGPVIDPFTVTLPTDADGRRQTAASNDGDKIDVAGRLDDCSVAADKLKVVLQPNVGSAIPVPVTRSADGCEFSGSITTGGEGTTFADGTTSFVALASASDAAGNAGSNATAKTIVDLVLPVFTDAITLGASDTSTSADRILVTFTDATTVFGGCSEAHWSIDGELLVRDVRYSDGSECVPGQAGPDNSRLLLLVEPRDQDLQTNVTYDPQARPVTDPAKDSAGQDALEDTIATVVGVVPAAPEIVTVTRGDGAGGREDAVLDGGSYYTNQAGNDLEVTFAGGRAGYTIRVLDGAGNRLSESSVGGSPSTVKVPLGTTDGTLVRNLQLVNTVGKVSELTKLTVVLDRIKPALGSVTKTSDRSVDVTFSEILASGTNFAEDWFVYENNRDQDPADPDDDRAYYQVGSVTGNGATRTLNTNSDLQNLGSVGADYLLRNPDGVRYEDRAGNTLNNTVTTAP